MWGLRAGAVLALLAGMASAQPEVPLPERWTEQVRAGATEWASPAAGAQLPLEWVVRVRASTGAVVTLQALAAPPAPPLLDVAFRLTGENQARLTARASGQPMDTEALSARTWSRLEPTGGLNYGWRFPRVRNLWEERDRREIGAAYAALLPFTNRLFTIRLVLAKAGRQVWIDDRLVAEAAAANPPAAGLKLRFQEAAVDGQEFLPHEAETPLVPLNLSAYSHAREAGAGSPARIEVPFPGGPSVPFIVMTNGSPDLDLGESLFRYRLTHGSGPDASYVNAQCAWPGAFSVDPAVLAFRVPHRPWQTAWLLVWSDGEEGSVPRGVFRFFRAQAGYPAASPFEIGDEAVRAGRAVRLDRTAPGGQPLYLVRVPLDTDGLAGMRDMAGQFLEFELTKPLSLFRSYPDPIYYGYHPAGPPSSLHVEAITLEAAPFDYEVKPDRLGHVFVRPEWAGYTVSVTNRSDRPLDVRIALTAEAFGGAESAVVTGRVALAARQGKVLPFTFDLRRNGWHGLKAQVEAGGVARSNTLSLVLLPPDTRTRGYADNETRFGIWSLWGHYIPMRAGAYEQNEEWLGVMRRLGLRRVGAHGAFLKPETLRKRDFLASAPHTVVSYFHRLDEKDPEALKAAATNELAQATQFADLFPENAYFYGGEWHLGREVQYAPWPRYTGDGDRALTADERERAQRHIAIFSAIGKVIREKAPKTRMILQWGAPLGTIAYMKAGMPRDLVDSFGMDAPMFELLPENPVGVGSIHNLWVLRQEANRLGWPLLPVAWCEGPFFPTCPGALTEAAQAEYQIRYWLAGLGYGVNDFQAGVVDFDAGNYYGAEHYGAGLFRRVPMACPKPAVAAVATATAMLCGVDPAGHVDLGVPTSFCMAFRGSNEWRYALWRVAGTATARLAVPGASAVVTDAMGNETVLKATNGFIDVPIGTAPVWLTKAGRVASGQVGHPFYADKPGAWTRPLPELTEKNWKYDGKPDKTVTNRHFAVRRIPDSWLHVRWGEGEPGFADALSVVLPSDSLDKPMAQRVGVLKPKRTVPLPGVPSALGVWVRGNGSWGRVVYRLRDAEGEVWSSTGTKDDWNCDDTHGWSYVNFEGWRYVRFPLPGHEPWDGARTADSVWWGSLGGDGIAEPPFALESIVVEARNEVPVAGVMTPVREPGFKLAGLTVEYAAKADMEASALRRRERRLPLPAWKGPQENPLARLAETGAGEGPAIGRFDEPDHFNDGRRMVIRFGEEKGRRYNLYLSRYAGGEGAELLKAGVTDGMLVTGLRPEVQLYLFLTSVGPDGESKPSRPFRLVTRDHFAEK